MTIPVDVRGTKFELMGYNRSLELCARMNYETENLDFIDTMKKGSVLYDLGACEGRFSIYAALKGIEVFAFEPETRNFNVLTQNLSLNDLSTRVRTFNVAIGERDGTGILKVGQPWEGGHQKVVKHERIREDLDFDFVEEQKVSVVSLDDFIKTNDLSFPDFIKVDIDGSEIPFLKGFKETLARGTIKGIIFELDKADKDYVEILGILSVNGYFASEEFGIPNEKNLFNIIFLRDH